MMVPTPSLQVPRGPYQGSGVIGEVTEALHAFLKEGWPDPSDVPRIVEDLDFEPKDRERIIYVYMYRVTRNTALQNSKRWREAKVSVEGDDEDEVRRFYERPPLYLDLYYLIAAHAKFRSEAEKLLGWTLLRLNEATHLVYRPRRYVLPDLTEVDSNGRPWSLGNRDEGVIMEKVALDLVDDLTVGDAVNFFNIHDAPFRPYVTYRARCAMEGALIEAKATTIRSLPLADATKPPPPEARPSPGNGKVARPRIGSPHRRDAALSSAKPDTKSASKAPFGPAGYNRQRIPPEGAEGDPDHED
jgi:hypothetical protein